MQCVTTGEPHWWTVLTSMFMHGGWFHVLGNMWFLWVFGNNIEDSMGHGRFVVFYLLCGACAAGLQMLIQPNSTVPMVGASGAISGVMGAYVLLYPRVRVHTLIFLGFFVTTVTLPAYVILGHWFLLQLRGGTASALSQVEGGLALWPPVGGFVAGMLLRNLLANPESPGPPPGASSGTCLTRSSPYARAIISAVSAARRNGLEARRSTSGTS